MTDYHIANLIRVARWILKQRNDWYNGNGQDEDYVPPPPHVAEGYAQYLKLHGIIRDAMKNRRQHRANVKHIWEVYAKSVIEARKASVS